MFLLVIAAYTLLVIYEFIPLYKQRLWRDFSANAVLGILSFTTAMLLSFKVKIPSPAVPIQDFITSIFGK
jgi:hypothetical protein